MDRGLLFVIVVYIVILLLTYFDRRAGGRWGVLKIVVALALLFFGMYAAQIVDPGNKDTTVSASSLVPLAGLRLPSNLAAGQAY